MGKIEVTNLVKKWGSTSVVNFVVADLGPGWLLLAILLMPNFFELTYLLFKHFVLLYFLFYLLDIVSL